MGWFGTNWDPPSLPQVANQARDTLGVGLGWGVAGPAGALAGNEIQGHLDGSNSPPPPAAPGIDPNLQRLKDKKLQNAQEFRAGMPNMVRMMSEDLKTQANQGLSQANRQTRESASSRGMLYSGVRQGQEQSNRAKTQAGVAQGVSSINAEMENAANTLDAQAVETGVGIQQTQQAIQNQIYSQAMAQMNARNMVMGSMIGAGAGAGLLASRGG